jgi:methionyl-tRNA synthetase
VVYVWIDALVNYLTGLGFPDGDAWQCTWKNGTRRTHVIGKNVWKFHAVYWPALLLAAGFDPPDEIVVHGFLTQDGRKISKSRGDAKDPLDYVPRFGADALRYYLLRHVRPFEDSDFSETRLEEVYEAELANGLGNLASRLSALCERFGVRAAPVENGHLDRNAVAGHFDEFRFDRALDVVWAEVDRINREIAADRPWESDPDGQAVETRERLGRWAAELRELASALHPFLPGAAARLRDELSGPRIVHIRALFPRL